MAEPGSSALSVVATGLNNPRHLSFSQGALYVAEAGTGGKGPCATGEEGVACVGRTGDIARISAGGHVTRLMRGLSSVAGAGGAAAAGPADVAIVGQTPVVVVQTTNISATNGSNPYGPAGNDLGKLVIGLRGGRGPSIPGVDFAAYEAAHNPDHGAPGDQPAIDSDPYALIPYRGGFAVADAAGNDILWVSPHGQISTLAVIPVNMGRPPQTPPGTLAPTQAVPTSVRVGPDGALYVSELSGFAGSANVLRVVPGHAPTSTLPASTRSATSRSTSMVVCWCWSTSRAACSRRQRPVRSSGSTVAPEPGRLWPAQACRRPPASPSMTTLSTSPTAARQRQGALQAGRFWPCASGADGTGCRGRPKTARTAAGSRAELTSTWPLTLPAAP